MRDRGELIRWNPDDPIEPEHYMRLTQTQEENNVSEENIRTSMQAVQREIGLTDEELNIAARIGLTQEQVLQQKAMDRLEPDELLLMRTGLTPVEILAARIVR